jgi:hypothetical protein
VGALDDLVGDGYPGGAPVVNHADTPMDALIDRMKEAATEELFRQAGHDFQRYVAENMRLTSAASVPFLQAAARL